MDGFGRCAFMRHAPRVWFKLGARGRCVWRFGELKRQHRRPELCRWRFQQLTRAVELENDPEAFAALNLDKGLPHASSCRDRYPLEDETARSHFQAVAHSCSSYAKIRRAALRERVGMDPNTHIKPHQSWKDCMKMFPLKSPAELAHI